MFICEERISLTYIFLKGLFSSPAQGSWLILISLGQHTIITIYTKQVSFKLIPSKLKQEYCFFECSYVIVSSSDIKIDDVD